MLDKFQLNLIWFDVIQLMIIQNYTGLKIGFYPELKGNQHYSILTIVALKEAYEDKEIEYVRGRS